MTIKSSSSSSSITSGTAAPPATKTTVRESSTFIIMSTMMLCMFLVSLDRTIIGVAIPTITDQFHSIDKIGWLGSAYMMTNACLQLLAGRIYKHAPLKIVLIASILLFEIGSAVCGAAPNMNALIVGRAIAGAGSAGIFSGVIQVTIALLPLDKRPVWMSIGGAIFGVSSALGPLLGGAFTTHVSWRWCFYINLPVGGIALLIVGYLLPHKAAMSSKNSIAAMIKLLDPVGLLLVFPAIVSLVLILQYGGFTYTWSDGRVIALWCVFGITTIAFLAWQVYRGDDALLPPRIVSQRSVVGALVYCGLISASMVILVYYLPIWFQVTKGSSAITSSYQTLPFILALVVASIVSGIAARKTGYYAPQLLIAPIFSSIGAGLMTTFEPNTGHPAWIGYQVLYGLGIGLGMQGPSLAVQASLPQPDVPIGIAATFFSREMAGAIFVSVAQNIFANKLSANLEKIAGIDLHEITSTGATELRSTAGSDLEEVVQAYNGALKYVWYVALGLVVASAFPVALIQWKNLKKEAEKQKVAKEGLESAKGDKGEIKESEAQSEA